MVKVTVKELVSKLQSAIQSGDKVKIKFRVKISPMAATACFEIAKDEVPFSKITKRAHEIMLKSCERTYEGVITSCTNERYNILTNNNGYKSFFSTNVTELSIGGFTYAR